MTRQPVDRNDPSSTQPPRRKRTEKVSEVVAREILHTIVNRELKSGARLPPEAEMLNEFQVGRASLREALRILESQGIVQIKPGPGGGPVVVGARSADLGRTATMYFYIAGATYRELVEARLLLEPIMARYAAERQDARYLAMLKDLVESTESVVPSDETSYRSAVLEFHDLVSGMSGNRVLDLIGRALKDIYADRLHEGHLLPLNASEREWTLTQHTEIAKAIIAGDGPSAEALMAGHMGKFVEVTERRVPGLLDDLVDWR